MVILNKHSLSPSSNPKITRKLHLAIAAEVGLTWPVTAHSSLYLFELLIKSYMSLSVGLCSLFSLYYTSLEMSGNFSGDFLPCGTISSKFVLQLWWKTEKNCYLYEIKHTMTPTEAKNTDEHQLQSTDFIYIFFCTNIPTGPQEGVLGGKSSGVTRGHLKKGVQAAEIIFLACTMPCTQMWVVFFFFIIALFDPFLKPKSLIFKWDS